jgi:hypothetical protein
LSNFWQNCLTMIATELINQQPFQFGFAWVLLSIALILHVTDEALTDFLSVYNPAVQAIRKRMPFLPLPIFTFRVWLAGLCLGILVAVGLSILAFRGSRLALVVAYPVAILMFGNGIGHIVASLYRRPSYAGSLFFTIPHGRISVPFCMCAGSETCRLKNRFT